MAISKEAKQALNFFQPLEVITSQLVGESFLILYKIIFV